MIGAAEGDADGVPTGLTEGSRVGKVEGPTLGLKLNTVGVPEQIGGPESVNRQDIVVLHDGMFRQGKGPVRLFRLLKIPK